MPASLINSTIQALQAPNVIWPQIQTSDQYLVLSYENGNGNAVLYSDGLKPSNKYKSQQFAGNAPCPASTTIKVPATSGLPFKLNNNQTVYFIRHVEAHPTSNFENGNFVCQGAWRANGANKSLEKIIGKLPKYILTTNPSNIIGCSGLCSYVRPSLTISPFAIQNSLALDLAAFQWNDPASLATALFTQGTTYSQAKYNQSTVLVAWEHGNIENAVKYLFGTVYNNPSAVASLPSWSFTDYDTVWVISSDAQGNLTFNNTCEGIPSKKLPAVCPAFMP